MSDLVAAFGLALVLEGVLYAAFPGTMRAIAERALASPPEQIRVGGLFAAGLGFAIVWFIKT